MTCGIYKLDFEGTYRVYVGQSVNIEKRYSQHINNFATSIATSKLQNAYNTYGKPAYTTLLECTIEDLDDNEEEAINIFNSVTDGFNTYYYADEAPTYSGHGGGNSRYCKEQIIQSIELLLTTSLTSSEISEITEVAFGTVSNLARTEGHPWVWQEFPDKKEKMLQLLPTRITNGRKLQSDKLSAKSRGITYPSIMDPEGTIYIIDNAYSFAKSKGLAPNHFQEVLNGHRKTHKGWKLCPKEQVF
jgi:hypothetical protein